MTTDETRYLMALTRLSGLPPQLLPELCRRAGSAAALYEHRHSPADLVPDLSPRFAKALTDWDDALARTDAELQYCQDHHIRIVALGSSDYPQRLAQCADAPLVLYFFGTSALTQARVVSIVGTRHLTAYGTDLIRRFVAELKELCPEVLIVSGLAYGADVCAHRAALEGGIDTVGVLAHGLDELYPAHHRDVAAEMTRHGGLLTEYMTQTRPEKRNFVHRNRIVAGLADAVIVVESASRGGSLITADIAQGYDRSVFAFPGRVGAPFSEGCNQLIRRNVAGLITSAADFVESMGWQADRQRLEAVRHGIERELFADLSPEEQTVADALRQQNDQQLNTLAVKTNLPIGRLTALLFQLEMKGILRPMAGGCQHLII